MESLGRTPANRSQVLTQGRGQCLAQGHFSTWYWESEGEITCLTCLDQPLYPGLLRYVNLVIRANVCYFLNVFLSVTQINALRGQRHRLYLHRGVAGHADAHACGRMAG